MKRRSAHPLGPTVGWYGAGRLDYTRLSSRNSDIFTETAQGFKGYVQVTQDSFLQARSYDDIYGTVYCGFGPQLKIRPSEQRIFVTVPRCAVGDGGLAQVTGICKFENGNAHALPAQIGPTSFKIRT